MSKHTGYYELRDALQEPGCAICRLGEKAVARYLAGLVYANANDYQVRAEVKLARGFCTLHAWQLRDCHGAGLDIAILSADVLAAGSTPYRVSRHRPHRRTSCNGWGSHWD